MTLLWPPPLCDIKKNCSLIFSLILFEMLNDYERRYLLKPHLASKQNFLLPKPLRTVFQKSKKVCVTLCLTPHPRMSRIIWMTPKAYYKSYYFVAILNNWRETLIFSFYVLVTKKSQKSSLGWVKYFFKITKLV